MLTATSKKPYGHNEYFAALDGFRGLLALLVAIHHTTWFSYVNYRSFINEGFVIIDLFFAFSGFLMFTLYQDKLTDSSSCLNFMRRRFARLYPIHLFMLAIFLGFSVLRVMAHKTGIATHDVGEILPFMPGAADGWGSLLSHLTLTHSMGLHDSLTYNFPSWTISVEFFAYFVFMAMMVWLPPRKSWHFGIITLLIAVTYLALAQVKPNIDITYDLGFFRCLGGFFTGVLAAWVYGKFIARHMDVIKSNVIVATFIEIAMVLVSLLFILYFKGKLQFLVAPVMFGFIIIFALDSGWVSRLMSLPLFRYLAKISYSVYMVHVIIAIGFSIVGTHFFPEHLIVGDIANGLWGDVYIIPYLLCVIGFSHLTYHFVEVPGSRFIRNFRKTKAAVPVRGQA